MSLIVFGTAACGDNGGGSAAGADTAQTIPGVTVTGAVGSQPHVKIKTPLKADVAKSAVVTPGHGPKVVRGKDALLSIYVANGKTGQKAYSTYDQGGPSQVTMADGQFIPALMKALVGKPEGSRVAVAAPVKDTLKQSASQLGLGQKDSVLFVIDIDSVSPTNVLRAPQGAKASVPSSLPAVQEKAGQVTGLNFDKAASKPPGKLQVIPLVKGTGPKVRADSLVTFNYFGEVWGGNKPFDESYSRGPATFPVGIHKLIPAWDQGLVGVPQGSRVMIIAPPSDGYGASGNPQAGIKGTDTLVFIVDVLGVG